MHAFLHRACLLRSAFTVCVASLPGRQNIYNPITTTDLIYKMPAQVGKSLQECPDGFNMPVWDAGGEYNNPQTGKRFAHLTS